MNEHCKTCGKDVEGIRQLCQICCPAQEKWRGEEHVCASPIAASEVEINRFARNACAAVTSALMSVSHSCR